MRGRLFKGLAQKGAWRALCASVPSCVGLALTAFLGSASALHAQYVVTYQGTSSSDPTVTVFDPSNFSTVSSFTVPGAFQFLSLANGTKHYFVSNTPGAGITAVDNTFSNPYPVGNIQGALGAGALTPDGSRLVVATAPMPTSGGNTSAVYVFSTSTDLPVAPQGLSVVTAVSAGVVDVAVSYDSQTAYALGNVGQGKAFLTSINLQQNSVSKILNLSETAHGLALGPNGLLYVSAQNQILEIDPATLIATSAGTIDVNAPQPERAVFTPDGHYAVVANQALGAGPAITLIDLTTHQVAGTVPSDGLAGPIDKLMAASSSVIYAWSSYAQSLYTLQIGSTGGIILTVPNVPGVSFTGVTAEGLSNDFGIPGRNYPQFLFVASGGILYRIDPATSIMSQQVTLSSNPGDLAYWSPTATGNTPVTVLQYGDNQTIAPGATSLPLVVRFLDANGVPVSGVPVDFSVSAGTGTFNPPIAATGADGFVQTRFTAGTTAADIGSFTITVGGSSASFTINVGSSTTSSGPTPAQMSIVSGQGQIVLGDPSLGNPVNTLAPFTVLVTDPNGNPVPNALVTFTWTSGFGINLAGAGYGVGSGQSSLVVATDSTGHASSPFLPPPTIGGTNAFETDTITASLTGINSVNFYVTGVTEIPGTCIPTATTPCPSPLPPALAFGATLLKPPFRGFVFSGGAGSTLPDAIEVVIATFAGVPIPNVSLQVYTGTAPSTSDVSCSNPAAGGVALSNANGMAECDLLLNGALGTMPLTISIGGVVTFLGESVKITPGPPTQVNIVGGNQQFGTVGVTLPMPFVVQVTDAFSNPLSGAPVNWQVASGSMTLSGVSSSTNSAGLASATATPIGAAGNDTVLVTAGTGSATFTALATVPAASITITSGTGQSAAINEPFSAPLVVQVADVNGNPASFTSVSFTVQQGSALLSATSVMADVNGAASITAIAGSVSGPVYIVAASGNASATFSLTVLPLGPNNVVILNAASFTANISPGGLAAILGSGLAPTIQGAVTSSSQMAGYSVTFGSTVAPIIALVNQNGVQQISIQVPFEAVPGANTVTIQTPQGSLTVNGVMVSSLAPGIFSSGTLAGGSAQAVALRPNGSYVTAANPAQRGENITLFATGLGLTVPLPATNVPGVPGQVVSDTVYAGVNNAGVAVVSAVYQPGVLGVYAVTIQIPSSTAAGSAQPVSLAVVDPTGASYASPDAYLPIQ
jgi:uncharacterized protein (TIGR03437 family)